MTKPYLVGVVILIGILGAALPAYSCALIPIPVATADPTSVCVNDSLTFDGSDSVDPDNPPGSGSGIVDYSWSITTGLSGTDWTIDSGQGTDTLVVTFLIAGTYRVELDVLDDDDDWSSSPDWVDVTVFATPDQASNPDPSSPTGSQVDLCQILSWTSSNSTSFDVYLSDNQSLVSSRDSSVLVSAGQTESTFDATGYLNSGDTFYWRVDSYNVCVGSTGGDVWEFDTGNFKAHTPDPTDDATDVVINKTLTWLPGDGAISHNIYFGENSTNPEFRYNTSDLFYPTAQYGGFYYGDSAFTTAQDLLLHDTAAANHWDLDEGIGPTAFNSTSGPDGTLNGGTAWTTSGYINDALSFDGSNDYVSIASNGVTTTEFTVAAWAKPAALGGGASKSNVIFAQREDVDGDDKSAIVLTAELSDISPTIQALIRSSNGSAQILKVANYAYNEWHHYAITVDLDDIVLYIDGVEVIRIAANQTGNYTTSIDYVDIGRHRHSGVDQGFFNGLIDEVRIYDSALNQDEIFVLVSSTDYFAETLAYGINENSDIVGASYNLKRKTHAVINEAGGSGPDDSWTDLHPDGDTGASIAYDINDDDEIVGQLNGQGFYMDYSVTTNPMVSLPSLFSEDPLDDSAAHSINEESVSPVAVGWSGGQAVLWETLGPTATIKSLGAIDPYHKSKAYDVNDSKEVVGYHYLPDSNPKDLAFVGNETKLIDIGTLAQGNVSRAYGINNAGQVVGEATVDTLDAQLHAFVYDGGQLVDLNDRLVDTAGGMELISAQSVNDSGAITGYGKLTGPSDPPYYRAFVLAPALPLGNWKFDQNGGAAALDSSINGRHGQITGASWVVGKRRSALLFDGIDDKVVITGYKGIPGSKSRTVTAWIKTSVGGDVISWGDDVTNGDLWAFRVLTANGHLELDVKGETAEGGTDVSTDLWVHVAAVLTDDGSPNIQEVQLYVNGISETVTSPTSQTIDTVSGNDLHIGYDANGGAYFDGSIDEVRVYPWALDVATILKVMDGTF
jgi:probable HAF family extracellular repeat protein